MLESKALASNMNMLYLLELIYHLVNTHVAV